MESMANGNNKKQQVQMMKQATINNKGKKTEKCKEDAAMKKVTMRQATRMKKGQE